MKGQQKKPTMQRTLKQLPMLRRELYYLGNLLERNRIQLQSECGQEVKETLRINQKRIKNAIYRRREEFVALHRFIESVPDSVLRQIFILRYEQGNTWLKVSMQLGLPSADAARKKQERYWKECAAIGEQDKRCQEYYERESASTLPTASSI